MQEILAVNLQATEIYIQKNKQVLAQLQNQIAQFRQKFNKNYRQQKEQQLLDFTAKLISVKVVKASQIKLTRSFLQIIAIAIASSFLLAVAVTLDQQLGRDKPMSNQKTEASKDV